MNHASQWNARFAAEDYVFGTEPNLFLTQQAEQLPTEAKVLCVADGEGRNGVWLAALGHDVTSIDIAEVGLAKARKLAQERGVSLDLQQADLATWDWPEGCFDAVVAIFIQFAASSLRTRIFAGMQRATRPGGLILLQGYRPEQIAYGTGGPGMPDNLYTEDMLREAFADWKIEHLASHDSILEEGRGHSGISALIDLVARKPV
ncbi:methyltransferase domain-containing protein [Novosphingobium sp. FSY-8]|uniref:Methyltransferase domain-containing protein n=1 Tax=Novosphingobium ovatum TaxID=1908523 RepID=A0ABW9XF80_9SPHN|nr:class I SAM-dependent methyltransferase [Novosphingobium ovatum]NBC37192.1 methyltransferase domain-containing protein [Novosphingobium ovatum]